MTSHRDAPYWIHSDPTQDAATDRKPCVVKECYAPRVHEQDCTDDNCTGCAPGLAAAGLEVCTYHRDQIANALDRLPTLYAQLAGYLAPYRSPQAPKGDGGRTTETPDVLNAAVFEARAAIARKFQAWCAYVTTEQTLQHQADCARRGVTTTRVFPMPRPTVDAMGDYLRGQVDWLCRDRLAAPAVGARLQELLGEAVTLRNRSRAAGLFLGLCPITTPVISMDPDGRVHRSESPPCGGSIRYDRQEKQYDSTYQPTCPRCRTTGSLIWWQQRLAADAPPPTLLPAVSLAMILDDSLAPELAAVGKRITPSTIGKWKYDGHIAAVACDLTSKRDLFDRQTVEAVARDRYRLNPPEGATA